MSVFSLTLRAVLPLAVFVLSAAGAPTVATMNPPAGTVSALTSVSITFSEPVTNVDLADLQVNGDNASSVTGAGAGPYVFSFTQPPPGTISVSWEPDHGIAGIGTGVFVAPGAWSYTLTDSVAPAIGKIKTTVAGQEADAVFPTPGSTVAALTQATVTFSEPVTGVNPADLSINGTSATAVTGGAEGPYVFTFAAPADGAVTFQWAAGSGIMDSASNAFAGGTWGVTKVPSLGAVEITEFLAANAGAVATTVNGTRDENFDLSPWIELTNTGADTVDLTGWSLSNEYDPPAEGNPERWGQPDQWVLPARSLPAGARLVIWASGKDRKPATGHLHTNFSLNPGGGSIGLFRPDSPRGGPVSSFKQYPGQRYDYSYGLQSTDNAVRYFSPPTVTQTAYVLPSSGNPSPAPPAVPLGAVNNTSALTGVTLNPAASVARGYFNEPFQAVLSCATAGATIRYTLNGTPPVAASTVYAGPLTISATTVLRFAAFGTGLVPSEAVTHSYLFLDNVVNQPGPPYDNPANSTDNTNPQPPSVGDIALPVAWGSNGTGAFPGLITNLTTSQVPADYGMDPKVYADPTLYDETGAVNAAGRTNLSRIQQALRELPMVSVVLKPDDMWGPGGLYPTGSESDHSDRTKPCSLEMIQPDGTTGFHVDCGIDLHGNASRAPYKNPKHGFTLRFKGKYGSGKVEGEIFPDSPVREWDKLVLRGDFNSSWLHQNGSPGIAAGSDSYQRPRGIRIRDAWCKGTFRDMGHAAGHHRFANLFINGLFWGTYELAEDEADDFGASYLGGEKADYDVIDQGTLKSGTWTAYYAMKSLLGWTGATFTGVPSFTTAFTNAQYEQIKQYLDVPWFIDYMLLHFYSGHRDWGTTTDYNKNWYVIRHKNGTFKYLPWDQENLLWHEGEDRTTGATTFTTSPSIYPPTAIHPRLKSNIEYRLDFADRVHRTCVKPGGALTPAANIARLTRFASIMNANAMCLESARWGDYRYKVHPYTLGTFNEVYSWNGKWFESGTLRSNTANTNNWLSEINRLKNTYFPIRTNNLLTQLRTNSLYPALNAPEFRNNSDNALTGDQRVTAGYQLKMQLPSPAPAGTVSAGTVYYTLDGSDPRVAYDTTGQTSPGALNYTGAITINTTTMVKARTLNTTTWSALMEATFSVGPALSAVVISEIHYNPRGTQGGTSAEFIEIFNAGTTGADLSGWSMQGVDFIFPQDLVLGPGDRLVIVSNNAPAVFAAQYPGVVVAGYFGGSLDNGGERLSLFDQAGHRIFSVEYADTAPWPAAADNGGYSLELADPAGDPQSPHSWRASSVPKGNPGTGSASAVPAVIISEFLAAGGAGFLPGPVPVVDFVELHNQGGAAVNIGNWSVQGAIFPPNTMLGAGARLVVQAGPGATSTTKLPLPFDSRSGDIQLVDANGTVIDGVRYGPQVPNASFIRSASGWIPGVPTPAAPNVAAAVPATLPLRINEFLADPAPGEDDWIEFYNADAVNPVALSGCSLERNGEFFRIAAPAIVPANGYLRMFCDAGSTRGDHINLNLPAEGASLTIRNAAWETLDTVTYGLQLTGVSQGRVEGTPGLVSLPYPSPGVSNLLLPADRPVLNEVLVINRDGPNAPWARRPSWVELKNPGAASVDLSGWRLRTTLSNLESAALPAGTILPPGGLLAVWCDPMQPSGVSTGPHINAAVNISDILSRWSLELVDPGGHINDRVTWGLQIPDLSFGRLPDNSWALLSTPTRGTVNAVAASLASPDGVKINEWANAPTPGSFGFIELYNPGAGPVAIGGLWLSDDPGEALRRKWQVPALTFIAGHGLALLVSGQGTSSPTRYLFDLSPAGEYVRLGRNDAATTVVDSFSYGLAPPSPQTLGRLPDGTSNVVTLNATPGTPNTTTPGPVIYDQPDSAAAAAGKPFGMSIAAGSSTGQWFRNGLLLPGQTSATLNFASVSSADEGDYTWVATNADGTTTSQTARLTVLYTYAAWAAEKGIASVSGDADSDGITNGEEFVAGTNPLVPASPAERLARHMTGGSETAGGTSWLTMDLMISRRAAFSSLTGELSSALSPWTVTAPDSIQTLSTDPNGDVRLRHKFLLPPSTLRRFLRMRLTP